MAITYVLVARIPAAGADPRRAEHAALLEASGAETELIEAEDVPRA